MEKNTNPQVHLLVKEAVEKLVGVIKYQQIRDYINSNWKGVNQKTIDAQIIAATVNHNSRKHYPENHKERKSDQGSPFDLLYWIERGTAVKYNSEIHGIWELRKNEDGTYSSIKMGADFSKSTYLFSWNPSKWPWNNLNDKLTEYRLTGKTHETWTCSSRKKVAIGDRAFLMKLGAKEKNKGIFASGYVMSEPFLAPAVTDSSQNDWRVIIEFDVLFNPNKEVVVELGELQNGELTEQMWLPQTSGIEIKSTIALKLKEQWLKKVFLVSEIQDIYSDSEKNFWKVVLSKDLLKFMSEAHLLVKNALNILGRYA